MYTLLHIFIGKYLRSLDSVGRTETSAKLLKQNKAVTNCFQIEKNVFAVNQNKKNSKRRAKTFLFLFLFFGAVMRLADVIYD